MLKKLIYVSGIICLLIVLILNFIFSAYLDSSENITINFNNFIYVIGMCLSGVLIFFIAKYIDKYFNNNEKIKSKEKMRKYIFIFSLAVYILFNIVWVIVIRPPIIGDTGFACDLAETFYSGDLERFLPKNIYPDVTTSMYMQGYHQQISLAFVFNIIFRIMNFQVRELLRGLNVISNALIVAMLYKISSILCKKYKVNKVLLLILILTFISLPMLSTFVYGDIPSLALCLISVYFIMKYEESKSIKFVVYASMFTMIAFMMRMNSLIFIIATVIYMVLNLFKDITKKKFKDNLLKVSIVVGYIVISIVPSILVQNYYLSKCDLDKSISYPNESYFLMAMEESRRGNGWYNEARGEYALKNMEKAKYEYREEISKRVKYFSENLGEAFNFYTMKLASMWTENTYSAINVNTVGGYEELENIHGLLNFYQKVLLVIICMCSMIVLIQNRKYISLEVIFLITIFIGGFAFHILWEAKSRYIIPYIVVLIPVAAIHIKDFSWFKDFNYNLNVNNIKKKGNVFYGKIKSLFYKGD